MNALFRGHVPQYYTQTVGRNATNGCTVFELKSDVRIYVLQLDTAILILESHILYNTIDTHKNWISN